jgi:pimeloyl-ACP methyl ester carboxylesterase
MAKTIYALFVGIDKYADPVPPLNGCVNDILAADAILRQRTAGDTYKPLILKDSKATRQNIIDGFRQHLAQATDHDVALFYYSGHGSQEDAPPEFWPFEPDKLDETLVCYDSRNEGNFDLADKELAALIAEVATNGAHVVIILDCCHSGTATRALPAEDVRIRRAPTDHRKRPLESFILKPSVLGSASTRGAKAQTVDWVDLPEGKHVVLSACRADQTAKEYRLGGAVRGAFSYFLQNGLQQAGPGVTYRDLFKRVHALVRNNVAEQTPQFEASGGDIEQPFLGGAVAGRNQYLALSHDTEGWIIDAGAVHGIAAPDGDETTTLAIFAFDSTGDQLRDPQAALGTAKVIDVLPDKSTVDVVFAQGEPDPTQTYKAVVTGVPVPPSGVVLEGDRKGVKLLREALKTASNGQPSLYVREVKKNDGADLRVLAQNDTYSITRPTDDQPLVAPLQGFTDASAAQLVGRLEHIARWNKIVALANPLSTLASDAVEMRVFLPDGPPPTRSAGSQRWKPAPADDELRLEYTSRSGEWIRPRFRIELRNTSDQTLHCGLMYLGDAYDAIALLAGGTVELAPGQSIAARDGKPLAVEVPDELYAAGITQVTNTVKLIVSTAPFDALLLELGALDTPPRAATRSLARRSPLNRLLGRIQTRGLARDDDDQQLDDWTTDTLTLTVVRPLDVTLVPQGVEPPAKLGTGVAIQPHPALRAGARLTSAPLASRDLGNQLEPPLLRDNPHIMQPFFFAAGRGSEAGLSVLELVDVENYQAVTPEQPLIIEVDTATGRDVAAGEEHVLPVGFDGEFYLPLGYARQTDSKLHIELDRLPKPLDVPAIGARSLLGSIRILFHKVVGQRLKVDYPYPLLAAAEVTNDGTVTYHGASDDVRARVAAAQRIVLYIHGIIGDTRGMAASVRGLPHVTPPLPMLADRYDLVLTFDYENINTPIEDTAQALKERLEAAGLGPGHGKTLDIVAHSMGGLVARWFIEHQGGKKVVRHLIMLGTPNAGSPWPTVQDVATAGLALALNSLTAVAWPVKVLGSVVGALEKIDATLDQMRPGSSFLKELERSDDPGVPYTVIAGNVLLQNGAAPPSAERQSRIEKLFQRIKTSKPLHVITAPAFFGQPNDIAAMVESINHVPATHTPTVVVHQVACDHLTYFNTDVGLRALAEAVT